MAQRTYPFTCGTCHRPTRGRFDLRWCACGGRLIRQSVMEDRRVAKAKAELARGGER